ncbi:hypothetical protein DFH06DRAFT_1438330 [Mycena polygramma]|nr:hypothetical protein DFH06DRAFT_1438330 [Mycena polygramma]
MSAFASLALSTKSSFQPVVAFIADGLRLFVGPNTAEEPDIASTHPGANLRVPDATKTIFEPPDVSFSFPLIMGSIFAVVALCLAVLSLKGVAGASAHSGDGFKAGKGGPGDNPPEPNDSPPGDTSIREVKGTQRANGQVTNDEEPPPPPPPGATSEAAHRLPNWWIQFLLWLFQLLRRTLRLFWAWRWTAIPSAVAYLFGDKIFWSFITARWAQTGIAYTLQCALFGWFPWHGLHPVIAPGLDFVTDDPDAVASLYPKMALVAARALEYRITGVYPWGSLHPAATLKVLADSAPLGLKICATALPVLFAVSILHLLAGAATAVLQWTLGTSRDTASALALNPPLLAAFALGRREIGEAVVGGLASGVNGFSLGENIVLIGSTLTFYGFVHACRCWGLPWNWRVLSLPAPQRP